MTLSATCAYAGGTNVRQQYHQRPDQPAIAVFQSDRQHRHDSGRRRGAERRRRQLIDITTMNNTRVQNSQIVGPNAAIDSNVNTNVSNIWGSVGDHQPGGLQRRQHLHRSDLDRGEFLPEVQRVRSVLLAARQYQQYRGRRGGPELGPGQQLRSRLQRGEHADRRPSQINNSMAASTVHANVSNIGGSTSLTSSAIGNTAQIIHYSTH